MSKDNIARDSSDSQDRMPWEMSLGQFVDEACRRQPDKVFVEIIGQSLTYGELRKRVAQTAGMFQSLGVGRGDRVGLFMPNCAEYLLCWFGLSSIGAISVPKERCNTDKVEDRQGRKLTGR